MSRFEVYHTDVAWTGGHEGRVRMGNGPELDFAAPPESHGRAGVLTPEDAFVAAVNTCFLLMFIWSAERFKLDLVSYACRAEGTKRVELDRTETFVRVVLKPLIEVRAGGEATQVVTKRVHLALAAARKYSLVANSIKSELVIEPDVSLVGD